MLISIDGGYPITAPHKAPWLTANGLTRTDAAQYTTDAEFMALANAVVVPDAPSFDASTEKLSWSGIEWVVSDKTAEELKAEALAKAKADLAATDAEFKPRWFEDLASGTIYTATQAWIDKRTELRTRINELST